MKLPHGEEFIYMKKNWILVCLAYHQIVKKNCCNLKTCSKRHLRITCQTRADRRVQWPEERETKNTQAAWRQQSLSGNLVLEALWCLCTSSWRTARSENRLERGNTHPFYNFVIFFFCSPRLSTHGRKRKERERKDLAHTGHIKAYNNSHTHTKKQSLKLNKTSAHGTQN